MVAARQPFCYIWTMKIKEKFISTTVKKGLDLLAEIGKRGYEAYIAGGAVRDLAMLQMGMEEASQVHDVDIATNMPIEELKLAFRCDSNNGEKHGTILVHYDGMVFEVTQFRVDGDYSDGRHPDSVSFTKSFKEDCARRDFTINAMGLDKDLNVVDYFGGIEDLVFRRLRAVGTPYNRMTEDSLRIIRGMRFAARFNFVIDELTKRAMHNRMHSVANVAMERIHDEFRKCAGYGPSAFAVMIGYLAEFGFGPLFHHVGFCLERQRTMVEALSDTDADVDTIMAVFICMFSEKQAEFLRCTKKEIKMAKHIREGLISIASGKFSIDDENIVYAVNLAAMPEFAIIGTLHEKLHLGGIPSESNTRFIATMIAYSRKTDSEYGEMVAAEGVKQGPEFGKRLNEIRLADYCRIRDDYRKYQRKVFEGHGGVDLL